MNKTPIQRILQLVKIEHKNIRFLYAYAIISGAISLTLPLGIQALMGLVLGGRLSSSWLILVLIITAGVLVAGLASLAQISILENIQQKLFVKFAFDFSNKITHPELQKKKNSGFVELSEKFLDIITLQKSFSKLLLAFTASLLQIIFGLILLVIYHPFFIAFALIVVLVIGSVIRLTWNRGISTARRESDYKFKTAYWITQIAQNRTLFHLKSHTGYHLNRTDEYLNGYIQGRKDHFKILYSQAMLAISIKVILTAALVLLGSYLLVNEFISIGQFLAAEILIITLLAAVEKLILTVENIYDSGIALEKLGYISDQVEDERNGLNVKTLKNSEINTISFISEKAGLKQIAEIKSGEKIGITGKPGTGRTKILKSIVGDNVNGIQALINQIPVRNIQLSEISENTGLCMQSNDLFEGSLVSNIALDKNIDLQELSKLANILNFQEFVTSLPEGFDYIVRPDARIPNNIMRKLLLARSLYQSPAIVLIDDIWEIFNRNEISNIMNYIKTMNSTVIIISNHLPILENMDRCFYLNDDLLEETGKLNENNIPANIQMLIWK